MHCTELHALITVYMEPWNRKLTGNFDDLPVGVCVSWCVCLCDEVTYKPGRLLKGLSNGKFITATDLCNSNPAMVIVKQNWLIQGQGHRKLRIHEENF